MIVDSHCHLDCLEGGQNLSGVEEYLQRAQASGVSRFLCVCIDWENFPMVKSLAQHFPQVYASVGVHPNHKDGKEPTVEELVNEAKADEIVAIGETGLDYFRSQGDLDWQRERFARHIEASKQSGKPLIIHTREAKQDTISMMQSEQAIDAGGVMHCFAEDWDTAKAAMDMGFYISFSGIVTFKSATELQEVARRVPIDRMLVETDSPYLAPVPHRGKQNEPAYVKHVVDFIAQLRGESSDAIAQCSSDNFFRLFSSAA
ncbi:MAG: TatD family hydrolase [Gammaproteobacteria bacterium]|nr:TatD family hydrolase [Gammaproteobacteria bacterium]